MTCEGVVIVWLLSLTLSFEIRYSMSGEVFDEWRWNILVLIFKNKGMCKVVFGIKLMSHTMKSYKRIIEHRLKLSISPKINLDLC
jgi:hypothetical protein